MAGKEHVGIMGAGLAGSLLAVLLAKQGYKVDVFERREDSRSENFVWDGRSINLALSTRGRKALRKAGIEEKIVAQCIPMKGRMMHDLSGNLSFMKYGVGDQAILSAGRRMLNEELMSAAEQYPNVKFHFNTGCKKVNVKKTSVDLVRDNGESFKINVDTLIGTDGAYSNVRTALQRTKGIDYQQTYLPHGYKELTIPPNADGDFAMFTNALHIWPRGDFMMIALPNPDKTFTATLFMPWDGENGFNAIKTEEHLLKFWKATFPDSLELIPGLVKEFFTNPTGYLMSIKCNPWYSNNTMIMGDAAHAIVPFYGQGMNCSLEDADTFDELLQHHQGPIQGIFKEFYRLRKGPADAVSKLSHDNYIEMRSHVASRWFLLRKQFENALHRLMPERFIPLYTMVSFSTIPYDEIIARNDKQTKLLDRLFVTVPGSILIAFVAGNPTARSIISDLLTPLFVQIKSAL